VRRAGVLVDILGPLQEVYPDRGLPLNVSGERGVKGGEVPKHLGGDSPLGHRARSTQEPELVVHPRVK